MKKIYIVTFNNEMEGYNKACTTKELAEKVVEKAVKDCKREWQYVSCTKFAYSDIITKYNINLADDDWEELVIAEIIEMPFEG